MKANTPRRSLIIGIDEYSDSRIANLDFAAADATGMRSALADAGEYQIPQEFQTLLTDARATRQNIIQALGALADADTADDTVVFYYAGHGCSEESEKGDQDDQLMKYIVPSDTDVDNLDSTAIDFHFLAERLNRIKCTRILMIFDCCHSGAAGGRTFPVGGSRAVSKRVGMDYLGRISGSGRMVMAACGGEEVAHERQNFGHGIFTHFLLEGLNGEADYGRDGSVDSEELWMYVQQNTRAESERKQNPVREGRTEGGPIYLSERGPQIDVTDATRRELTSRIVTKFSDYRIKRVRIAESDDIVSIGKEAADYLHMVLSSNSSIAVSCGRTLIETISQLPRSDLVNIEIFPLNGSPTDEVRLTDSMVLSYLLWSRFESQTVRARIVPTGVPSELFEKVEEGIGAIAERILVAAREADMFLFGIGSPSEDNKNIPYLLAKAGISADQIRAMNAVGEINFHLYDSAGTLLALSDRLSSEQKQKVKEYNSKFYSLSAEALVQIAKRPGVDLIVVAGGKQKREAIAAGIRGGFIRTLVTDVNTADWLANVAEDRLVAERG